MPYPPTPTLDKILALREQSRIVWEFLDWLGEQGIHLGQYPTRSDFMLPIFEGHDALLHRFFGIDAEAEEAEQRAVLEYVRSAP